VPRRPFGSIESKHGVDEPDDAPPQTTAEKLQVTGEQMASCGGSIVRLGCAGFLLLVVIAIVVAALTSAGGSGSGSEVAREAAARGAYCEAASIEPSRYESQCAQQKDREAKEKEDQADVEAIREGQRLKSEAAAEPESG
jgi:hypothetical protein